MLRGLDAEQLLHCVKGEHFRWPSSPTLDLLLTHCLIVHLICFQAATSERRKNVSKEFTKPIACSTFQRIWSPAKFVQIAFRSHLLVSSYGPTSLWAYRPRLSAQTRMLHEIRQWSTVASCSHNIAILIPLCTDNMATPEWILFVSWFLIPRFW